MVELVLVVTIIGILSAIALPRYSQFTANQQLDAAARRVCIDLDMIRRRANWSSTLHSVTFDAASNSYLFVGVSNPDHPSQEYRVELDEPPYRVDIVSADFGGDSLLKLDGYGKPDTGGSVVLAVGSRQKTVSVDSRTGRIKSN